MRKIKVLHILHSFGIGGMEKGIAMLAQYASEDIEHVILCMSHGGASQDLLPPGMRVVELHKQAGSLPSFLWRLASAIRKEKPDIVHTRNWGGMDGIIAARLAGYSRIVHGEHGWGMDDPLGTNKKRIFIRRLLSLGVKEFTAVSQQIKNWLENDVKVFRPVDQIYNGVDMGLFSADPKNTFLKQELGLPESTLLVGSVGRLDPIKDHAGLIAAFKVVRNKFPQAHLVIVGDGPERLPLEALVAEGIHLLGLRSDVPTVLGSLDLFVLNSLNEGVSNTILEAMACGLPIVATDVGGTPELITPGHNGLLVQSGNQPALIQAIEFYLGQSEKRVEHGQINYCLSAENFSIESMVNSYESVWRRIFEKG